NDDEDDDEGDDDDEDDDEEDNGVDKGHDITGTHTDQNAAHGESGQVVKVVSDSKISDKSEILGSKLGASPSGSKDIHTSKGPKSHQTKGHGFRRRFYLEVSRR
ncbi:hypothetical protein K7432_016552, partial [Basidiobolus ranarum]